MQAMLGDKLDTVLITASAYKPNTASRHALRSTVLSSSAALSLAAQSISSALAADWSTCPGS